MCPSARKDPETLPCPANDSWILDQQTVTTVHPVRVDPRIETIPSSLRGQIIQIIETMIIAHSPNVLIAYSTCRAYPNSAQCPASPLKQIVVNYYKKKIE